MQGETIVAAAVQPVTKLIETVAGAIGKTYEPYHIRRMAKAKAEEIDIIGEKLRNNTDLPIVYNSENLHINTSNYEALVKRAGKRIAYQEIARQENIENILDDAYDSLKDIKACPDGEISREWIHRFIDAAGEISTEDLQKLWSKVLAGEVLEPRSFSLRTLECLRNLDSHDAKLFEKLCMVVSDRMVIHDTDFLSKHGLPYSLILHLDECGLINSSGMISFKMQMEKNKNAILIDFGDYVLLGKTSEERTFSFQQYPLTAAGRELSKIVGVKIDLDSIKEICSFVSSKNANIDFGLYKVDTRYKDEVSCAGEPIPF